jgi:hypothetical protein
MRKAICLLVFALLATSGWASNTTIIRPDGQGAYSAWTKSGCTYGWQCVDEVTANTTDYIYKAGVGTETFTFQNVSIPVNRTINSITLYYYGEDYFSGGNYYLSFKPMVRIGSTNYLGSWKTFSDTWSYKSYTMTTNPSTGSAWTVSQLNDLQAGIYGYTFRMGDEYVYGGGKLAQMYVLVDYV